MPLISTSQRYPQGSMPKSLYPQHIVQRFCSDENGTTLRVWNRHQSSLLPRGMRLVSNTRMLRYESCVESAQHSPSIQHMPVHGISGMRLPSHACMLSTSHTNSPLSSLGKAAYGSWGYAAGLKILRSQFSRQPKMHLYPAFLHFCVHDCPHDVDLMFPGPTAIGRAHYC